MRDDEWFNRAAAVASLRSISTPFHPNSNKGKKKQNCLLLFVVCCCGTGISESGKSLIQRTHTHTSKKERKKGRKMSGRSFLSVLTADGDGDGAAERRSRMTAAAASRKTNKASDSSGLPATKKAKQITATKPAASSTAHVSKPATQGPSSVPEGFFDDKKKEAKVQTAKPPSFLSCSSLNFFSRHTNAESSSPSLAQRR